MKQLITFLFIGLISLTVAAQKVAKIEFKSDTIDYGTIEKGLMALEFLNLQIQVKPR